MCTFNRNLMAPDEFKNLGLEFKEKSTGDDPTAKKT